MPPTRRVRLPLSQRRRQTRRLFIGHAEPSYVPSKPFVSYGDYSNSKTVADAMASKPAACAKAPVQDEAVGAAIAAAVVAAAVVTGEANNKSEYLAYWAPDSFTNSALASKAELESLRLGEGARCMLERAARGVDPSRRLRARARQLPRWPSASFSTESMALPLGGCATSKWTQLLWAPLVPFSGS